VERQEGGGTTTSGKPKKGTPQGGVISPLLANVYLHWFDKVFHFTSGPAQWANARLVRYADDFVVMARYQGKELVAFIETKLERWMGLELNREKTRIVELREGASLDFLGYTFQYYWDQYGRNDKYLNVIPSRKALKRERERLRLMTGKEMCFKPLPKMVDELNRHLQCWANYFSFGYPRKAFREINSYVRYRLASHLKRRSQRPFRTPEGTTLYGYLKKMGLVYL
jgi:RNA-directed DNA polymerase